MAVPLGRVRLPVQVPKLIGTKPSRPLTSSSTFVRFSGFKCFDIGKGWIIPCLILASEPTRRSLAGVESAHL